MPYLKSIRQFMKSLYEPSKEKSKRNFERLILHSPFIKFTLVFGVIALILRTELQTLHFNVDQEAKLPLHGAYEIITSSEKKWSRLFIHRDGYFILQDDNNEISDYKCFVNPILNEIKLFDYEGDEYNLNYAFNEEVHFLEITSTDSIDLSLTATALDWKELPALQSHFHWSVD